MAVSLQYPSSKKTREVTYETERASIDPTHYPNHSVGVRKHNCIIKQENHKGNLRCEGYRPVTRRNIIDMPNSKVCDRGCDDVHKCLNDISGKICPNIKSNPFAGIPDLAFANIGEKFMVADYYPTPCVVNGVKQCKAACSPERKTFREKVAFQDHVSRMHNAKQRCPAGCPGRHKATYCDGYNDPMINVQVYQAPARHPNNYMCEPTIYRPPQIDESNASLAVATRSFGTSTCTTCRFIGPTQSAAANTSCKGSGSPPPMFKPSSYRCPYVANELDYNGCAPTTCSILRAANKGGQTYITQQGESYDMRNASAQTAKQQLVINMMSSQTREVDNSPAMRCTRDSNRTILKDGETYCEDVRHINRKFCTRNNKNYRKALEKVHKKYKTMAQLEDNVSLDSTNMPEEYVSRELIENVHKKYETIGQLEENMSLDSRKNMPDEYVSSKPIEKEIEKYKAMEQLEDNLSLDSSKNMPDEYVSKKSIEKENEKYKAVGQLEDNMSLDNTNMPDDKGTSTTEDAHYESKNNILNNSINNHKRNSKRSNHRKTSIHSKGSNSSNTSVGKRKKHPMKRNSKDHSGQIQDVETASYIGSPKPKEEAAESEVSRSPSISLEKDMSSTDEESQLEINKDHKRKKVKGMKDKMEKQDKVSIKEVHKPRQSIVEETVSQMVDESKTDMTSDDNQPEEPESKEIVEAIETNKQQTHPAKLLPVADKEFVERQSSESTPSSDVSNKIEDDKLTQTAEAIPDKEQSNPDKYKFKDLQISGISNQIKESNEPKKGPTSKTISGKSAGKKPMKKVCAKRKGLNYTFKDPNERVTESLLKLSKETVGYVGEHEYLQFSLRITEDIIRNDLYTKGQMKRVFKSHLEANRGRLDTQMMIDQIHSLCKDLNISFDESLPLENLVPTTNCSDKNDNNYICCCEERGEALEAKENCVCDFEYYQDINGKKEKQENDNGCDCQQRYCEQMKCPGSEHVQLTDVSDFDFDNEGLMQTVMYSDVQCYGPRNQIGECMCGGTNNEMIRPSSPTMTGYIPSNDNATRRAVPKRGSESSDNKYFKGNRNKGKLTQGLKLRGVHRIDGVSTSNSNGDSTEDSAPVRIKTPVTAHYTILILSSFIFTNT